MDGFLKLLDWLLNKINFYILVPTIILILLILFLLPIFSMDIYKLLGWEYLLDKKGFISLLLLISIIIFLIKAVYDIVNQLMNKNEEKRIIDEEKRIVDELLKNEGIVKILENVYFSRPEARYLSTDNEDVGYLLAYELVFKTGGKARPTKGDFNRLSYPMLLTPKGKCIVENKLIEENEIF